jgi:1-deoxy-D-xylulose 5-phosphate reductoisomerase
MNKGFEMIEAKWLFGVQPEAIEIVVHPESIIHSAVRYADGAVIAQMGLPDMHLPISYAFSYPRRLPISGERMDLFRLGSLHFERPDMERFPCLRLAYAAVNRGGNAPCVLNAANEVVNLAFREGRIAFPQMAEIIDETMACTHFINTPTLDDYFETDSEARRIAASLISNT